MRDDLPRHPRSPLRFAIAIVPLATLAYIAGALIHDFSQVGDLPVKRKPAPVARPLPGRPAHVATAPPLSTRAVAGGFPAIAERLRPLHRSPAPEATAVAPGSRGPDGLGAQRVVYVQPIGGFTPAERRVADLVAELLSAHFGLPVRVLADLPVDAAWPARAKRAADGWNREQLLAPYVVGELLPARRPNDAAALVAVTARDLWSGEGERYVLGAADPAARTAVLSLFRGGDPGGDEDARQRYLRRALVTAAHVAGHALGLAHGSAYGCNLAGELDGAPIDRRPLWLCPDCEAELFRVTGAAPVWRAERLAALFEELELGEEAWFYERALYALQAVPGLAEPFSPERRAARFQPVCRRDERPAPWERAALSAPAPE